MPSLHISKVAVGCASIATLERRQALRVSGGVVPLVTRFMPKRAEELVGGSIFWIVKHSMAARQRIIGFGEAPADRRTIIQLDPELVAVRPHPKRAHQGWRYLPPADCPEDISEGDAEAVLPPDLAQLLTALALI